MKYGDSPRHNSAGAGSKIVGALGGVLSLAASGGTPASVGVAVTVRRSLVGTGIAVGASEIPAALATVNASAPRTPRSASTNAVTAR